MLYMDECPERTGTFSVRLSTIAMVGRPMADDQCRVARLSRAFLDKRINMSEIGTKTENRCTTAGIYRSDCADQERVTLVIGDHFPKCPSCRKSVGWNLAVAT